MFSILTLQKCSTNSFILKSWSRAFKTRIEMKERWCYKVPQKTRILLPELAKGLIRGNQFCNRGIKKKNRITLVTIVRFYELSIHFSNAFNINFQESQPKISRQTSEIPETLIRINQQCLVSPIAN